MVRSPGLRKNGLSSRSPGSRGANPINHGPSLLIDTAIARYTAWIIRHRILVAVLSVALSLALGAGVTKLTTTNDTRAFFSDENPQLDAFERLEAIYERQSNVTFLVVARHGTLFTPAGLGLIHALTERGWQAPYSRRVTSITNYQHTRAEGDNLIVAAMVDSEDRLGEVEVAAIRDIVLREPSLVGRVVGEDGKGAAVNIALTLPEGGTQANDEIGAWAKSQAEELRAQYPDFDIWVGGTTATDVALGEAVRQDVQTLILASYLVIFFGLLLLLRHVTGTVAAIVMVSLSIIITMGAFGWMGAVLEATAGFVPSIVMTIGVADAVHLLTTYYYQLRRGQDRNAALTEAMRVNASPIALTSVTTAIGVLMLNFSDSPPYQELGNMVALGVVAAWALSMTFLPAVIAIAPVRHVDRGARIEICMHEYAEWLIAHRRPILFACGIIVVTLASFIPSNKLGEKWHEYFDQTFEVRVALDAAEVHFGGLHSLHYDVRGRGPGTINEPRYLRDLETFAKWLEAQPEVTHVGRLSQLIERLNMNLHGDDPDWRRLPDSRELSAQLLLLYELSLPLGMGLESTIDVERAGTLLVADVRRMDSEQILAFDRRVQDWMASNLTYARATGATGLDIVFGYINNRNINSLLQGMVLALVLISVLLVFALRSLKLGALSLITNLAPAGLAYGTWALWDGTIDLSASVVICMSIGIVVDDTVHFLSKYRRARYETKAGPADALRYAFNTVGVALAITTAVLVAGFSVLGLSHFSPTITMGSLLAITLAYALLVDFLFLPPLLLLFDREKKV